MYSKQIEDLRLQKDKDKKEYQGIIETVQQTHREEFLKLKSDNTQLKEHLDKALNEKKASDEKLIKLSSEFDRHLKGHLSVFQREILDLQTRNDELQKDNDALVAETIDYSVKIRSLNSDIVK